MTPIFKYSLIIVTFTFFIPTLTAAPTQKRQLKNHMAILERELSRLLPMAIDSKVFQEKANKEKVLRSIQTMQTHISHAGNHLEVHLPARKVLRSILQVHLEDALTSYQKGFTDYSRKMVLATAGLCTRCHAQDNRQKNYSLSKARIKKLPPIAKAQFALATRQYRDAIHWLETAYQTQTQNKREILKNIIMVKFKRKETPLEISNYLEALKVKKQSLLGSDIATWKKRLKKLPLQKINPQFIKRLETEMEKEVNLVQNPKSEIDAIYLLGRYSDRKELNVESSRRLYHMALIERSLNQSYFFTPELSYLQTCIEQYTQSPYAQKCYSLYENLVKNSFTGSSGMDLPKEVKQRLALYKAKLIKASESKKR